MPDPQYTPTLYPTNSQPYYEPPDYGAQSDYGAQYPTNSQPYEPPQLNVLSGIQFEAPKAGPPPPVAAPTIPWDKIDAFRAQFPAPDWLRTAEEVGSKFYGSTIGPVVDMFQSSLKKINEAPDFASGVHALTTPFRQPLVDVANLGGNFFSGMDSRRDPLGIPWNASDEVRRRASAVHGLSMFGLPGEDVVKSYETGNWPALTGYGLGAAAMIAGPHFLGGRAGEAPVMDPRMPTRQPRLPGMENVDFPPPGPPDIPPPSPPVDLGVQPDLPGFAYRQGGRFIPTPSPEMRRGVLGPEVGTFPSAPVTMEDMAPVRPVEAAPAEPTGSPFEQAMRAQGPESVVIRNPMSEEAQMYRNRGYVPGPPTSVEGQVYPTLRRPDLAPTTSAGPSAPLESGARVQPASGLRFGEDATVPTERANLASYVETMRENGYTKLRDNPDGTTTFRHSSRAGGGVRLGMMDVGEAVNILRRAIEDVRDSGVATKLRARLDELTNRAQEGVLQISDEEWGRIRSMIPGQGTHEQGPPIPGRVEAPISAESLRQEPIPTTSDIPQDPAMRREMKQADTLEIQAANTVEEARAIANFWHEQLDTPGRFNADPEAMRHALDMVNQAESRHTQLSIEATRTRTVEPTDEEFIRNATTSEELDALIQQYNDDYHGASIRNDSAGMARAHELLELAHAREYEIPSHDIPPSTHARPTSGTGMEPEQFIREATTTEELDALSEHYVDELADARTQDERNNIINLQTFIEQRRTELLNQAANPARPVRSPAQDQYEIRRATTIEEAQDIRDSWTTEYNRADGAGDTARANHAHDMRMLAYDRIDELRGAGYSSGASSQIPRRTRAETITNLENSFRNATSRDDIIRARTDLEYELSDATHEGDHASVTRIDQLLDEIRKLPPTQERLGLPKRTAAEKFIIAEGEQPLYKGPASMEAEAYDDLANHARVQDLQRARSRMTPEQLQRERVALAAYDPTWDSWAKTQLSYVPDGPPTSSPTLTVTRKRSPYAYGPTTTPGPSNWAADYQIVYRDRDGRPVGTATVTQEHDGTRFVPVLAIDRFAQPTPGGPRVSRGYAAGQALYQVGMKLVDLGAAFTGGTSHTISQHTAHLIETIKSRVKVGIDESSAELASMIARLMKLKEMEALPPRRIRSPMDLANYIADVAGNAGPQPELPFEPRADRIPRSAAETEQVPQQMELGLGSAAQRELPFGTADMATGNARDPFVNRSTSPSDAGFIDVGAIGEGIVDMGKAIKDTIHNFFKRGPNKEPSTFENMIGYPTAATTIADLSMPLRQGLAAILDPNWGPAVKEMFRSARSAENTKAIHDELMQNKVHQKEFNEQTGKWDSSYAQKAGIKMIEGGDIYLSEHDVSSTWLERTPGIGRIAKISNRAAGTFMNYLRTHMLEDLSDSARGMAMEAETTGSARPGFRKQQFTFEQAGELNPYNNLPLARKLGEYINTATGRGSLGKLEPIARELAYALYSPRNLASRIKLLYPGTYIQAPPMIRKQYMKAAISAGAGWFLFSQITKGAAEAMGYNARISNDPESADFGKVRIGNTRLDPGGSFLQFYVGLSRLWSGHYRSSATGQRHAYGEGFRPETQESQVQRFFTNKLNPVAKFIYDVGNASQHNPFHVYDRTLQMFVPLAMQDFYELMKEDPKLAALFMPEVMLGGGTQTYSQGESVAKIIPKRYDWISTGGGFKDVVDPREWRLFGGK